MDGGNWRAVWMEGIGRLGGWRELGGLGGWRELEGWVDGGNWDGENWEAGLGGLGGSIHPTL